jgi:alkaline phosphatase
LVSASGGAKSIQHFSLFFQTFQMSKNNILIIGDGMGWEMTRSSAIYSQV